MNIDKMIEEYYAPKKGNEFLIKLIESKLTEAFGTDEMTLAVGSGRSEFREEFDVLMTSPLFASIKTDKYFTHRLDIIKKYLNPQERSDLRTDEFIATFIFLHEFDKILREYESEDARQAGFKFETLLTVLLSGIQVNGIDITDAEIFERGTSKKMSFKFYKHSRKYRIDGSLYNLLNMFARGEEVTYFVCLKNPPSFSFYSFTVTPNNFFKCIKKATNMYQMYFRDFTNEGNAVGSDLAKAMIEHMTNKTLGTRKEESTTELFDQQFLQTVYSLNGVGETLSNFDGAKASFEGDIQISNDIIVEAKLLYRNHELGKIGSLLEDTNKLNKQMLAFFALNGGKQESDAVLNNIDSLGQRFHEITNK